MIASVKRVGTKVEKPLEEVDEGLLGPENGNISPKCLARLDAFYMKIRGVITAIGISGETRRSGVYVM